MKAKRLGGGVKRRIQMREKERDRKTSSNEKWKSEIAFRRRMRRE